MASKREKAPSKRMRRIALVHYKTISPYRICLKACGEVFLRPTN